MPLGTLSSSFYLGSPLVTFQPPQTKVLLALQVSLHNIEDILIFNVDTTPGVAGFNICFKVYWLFLINDVLEAIKDF